MPEFGKHALSIYSAYGTTLGLLAILVIWSWARSRKVKRELDAIEDKRRG